MRTDLLYGLLALSCSIHAQNSEIIEEEIQFPISHSLHASGGSVKNESGSFAFTIGQVYHDVSILPKRGSVKSTIQRAAAINVEPNLEELRDEASILIHPNPFTDHFVLKFTDGRYDLSNYSLFDLEGRLLLSGKIDKSQTRINIAFLSSGLYILRVLKQNSIIKTLKILKN